MTLSAESRSHHARYASLTRSRRSDDPELLDARRALRTVQLTMHVQRELDAFPPMTEEQKAKVAALLRPSDDGGAR